MSRFALMLGLLTLTAAAGAYAVDDSFDVNASPAEVRRAMNDLGAAGLMSFPGPVCLKSLLVSGGVDHTGRMYYSAGYGLLGTPEGQLYQNADGSTHVEIHATVVSDELHRTVMGTPEEMARKITAQVVTNRRGS